MAKEKEKAQEVETPEKHEQSFFYPDQQIAVNAQTKEEADEKFNSLKEKK